MSVKLDNSIAQLTGTVQKGRGEGANLGFKTANLVVPTHQIENLQGVYSAYVVFDCETFKAAVSVGISPVYEDEATSNIEAHIIDFDGDIYGKTINVYLIEFLRPMIKFSSEEELVATVKNNINQAKTLPL